MENLEIGQNKKRMLLLLRNSTKKQAEKKVAEDGKVEYDIPLQRSILRPWGEKLGYDIIGELVEGGVSGYKVSTDKRDKVTELKAKADRGEFDVLGIYMSDRLGRIADETPLIVSFLNARGIKVLSYTEGEISAQTHNDKLMTYIRFWQAEGESLKTSMRIKDANEKAVEQGKWRGGNPPYGYRTASRGTLNFKGRPIFDVEIDPQAADIVKKVFKMYQDHYSFKGIAKYLNDHNVPTKTGALWSARQVEDILKNKIYLGIYELGRRAKNIRTVSPIIEYLRFLPEQDFYAAQEIMKKNRKTIVGKRPTIRGSKLLTGLLYCECGKKFTSQTHTMVKQRENGTTWNYERTTYRCGAYRTPKEGICNRLPIKAEKLETAVIHDATNFLQSDDIEKLLRSYDDVMREKEYENNEQLSRLTREKNQKEKELQKLKDEVYKAIIGESQFSQSLLSELIQTKEQELAEFRKRYEDAQCRAEEIATILSAQRAVSSELEDWAVRFDMQDTMEKKTMLINLIDKIVVFDDFTEITYNLQFDNLADRVYNSGDYFGNPHTENSNVISADFFSSQFVQRERQTELTAPYLHFDVQNEMQARTWGLRTPTRLQ